MRFDWQTEEDWEEEPAAGPETTAVSQKRKPLLWAALALLLILISAGWHLSQLAEDQVDGTTHALSDDLIAAYELLNSAAYESDLELFSTFLSGRNTYSRQLPLSQFRYQYFLDRPFLNLTAQPTSPAQPPQIEFSPDLTRAELIALQAYHPQDDPAAGPIWLERLTLFRKDDGRWRLTRWPIDETFWGETQEQQIGLLTAEYPARDQEHGRRLAQDISRLLDALCNDDNINCPPNFRLKMILLPYGQSLLDMNNNYRTLSLSSGYDAYRIFLPTPTLVGRPIDETGYQALYKGYAAWITAVLVQHYSRIRPVTHNVTADFLAQWQLSPPPKPVLPGPLTQISEPAQAPPIPLPDQDILMVCQGYSPPAWITYSPDDDTWQTISPPDDAPALAQMLQQAGRRSRFAPEGQGSLIRRPLAAGSAQSWHSYLWIGGLSNLLETAADPGLLLADPRHQTPDNGRLLFYPFDGQGNPYSADTAACLNNSCRLEQLEGRPTWSPSKNQTLLVIQEADAPQIYLGDHQGRPLHPLTPGYTPQWLDENTFLYVEPSGAVVHNGRLDNTGSLESSELLAGIPNFFSPQSLNEPPKYAAITHLAYHPSQPDWAILNVHVTNTPTGYLLLLNRQTGEAMLAFSQSNLQFAHPFVFSSDGRYLTIPAFEAGTLSGGWQLIILDLDSAAPTRRYNTETAYFDWSADSQWLLIAEENALRLLTPQHNYQRTIPHNLGCHTVGWQD